MRILVLTALVGSAFLSVAPTVFASQSEDIGPARRAYRAECTKFEPQGYCECITAGFAQGLSYNELTLARMKLRAEKSSSPAAQRDLNRAAPGLGFPDMESRTATFSKINALEADLQTTCGTT